MGNLTRQWNIHVTIKQIQLMYPMCYMYGIFTYIWVISRAYAGKYSLHGAYWTYIYMYSTTVPIPIETWRPTDVQLPC